jgi:hypothetical protein
MRRALIVVALTVVAGCGPVQRAYWTKPGGDQTISQRDLYECKREAAMVPRVPLPAPPPAGVAGAGPFATGGAFDQARNEAIYAAGIEAAQRAEQRAEEIYTLCMQTRGYRLEWRAE